MKLRRPLVLLLTPALALLAACAQPARHLPGSPQAAPASPASAVSFETRSYKLTRFPDPELELALEGLLSASYEAALRAHPGIPPDAGFTYSLAPKGAAYPFSEIEVTCIMRQRYASRGAGVCADFLDRVGERVAEALAARAGAEAGEQEE